ncbi:MAG: type II secretion system protein [Candidatus Hydrogenedentales bacterium]
MNAPRRAPGFTLIELLTVIAIIGILAGLIAAGLPAALQRAKIANLQGTFKAFQNSLAAYYADHGTYPPSYGYIDKSLFGQGADPNALISDPNLIPNFFITRPYMAYLNQPTNQDLYDNFSDTADTNMDGDINLAEYYPVPQVSVGGTVTYQPCVYTLSPGCDQRSEIGNEAQRPLLYFPVNKRQVQIAKDRWLQMAGNPQQPINVVPWDLGPQAFSIFAAQADGSPAPISFPPNQYDAYVLISVGPNVNTFGILPEDADIPNTVPAAYRYHVMALMAYFMATRDIDNNGALDFDFLARTRGGEGEPQYNNLPDPRNSRGAGPVIFKGE